MFCETDRELALYDLLTERFPSKHPQLLQLIAWCGINRPERLRELLEQHNKDGDEALIDLETFDITTLCPKVQFSITDEVAEIKIDE
jgi:hypothetical protein